MVAAASTAAAAVAAHHANPGRTAAHASCGGAVASRSSGVNDSTPDVGGDAAGVDERRAEAVRRASKAEPDPDRDVAVVSAAVAAACLDDPAHSTAASES